MAININENYLEIFNSFKNDGHFTNIGKLLCKDPFSEVREIYVKNKVMVGKIVRDDNSENYGKYGAYDIRGQNLVKIHSIILKEINRCNYFLIIMEKTMPRDLGKLNDYFHNHNLLKLIFDPFKELTGDYLLKFYCKQIINALEILKRCNYVLFDLKPENLLISTNFIIKLSYFSLLKKIKDKEKLKHPGGTDGYLSLDYYKNKKFTEEEAYKQEYFSLGATLYYLKYGQRMLKFKKCDNNDSFTPF